MTPIRVLLACLICWLCSAWSATAAAATIAIMPSYVQSFDAAQTPLGKLAADGAGTPVGGYLQIEFRMTVDELAPNEDFWTAIFDLQFGPGLERASSWLNPGVAQANGYYPAAPSLSMYDSNGATVGGVQAHWQFGNADFGLDPNDLQGIIVEASSAEAANRQYGEAARPGQGAEDGLGFPTLLGTILVRRTGSIASTVAVVPIEGSAWGTYTGNELGGGDFTSQPSDSFSPSVLQLAVPEPATISLAICALLAQLLVWRHPARKFAKS